MNTTRHKEKHDVWTFLANITNANFKRLLNETPLSQKSHGIWENILKNNSEKHFRIKALINPGVRATTNGEFKKPGRQSHFIKISCISTAKYFKNRINI